MARSYKRDNSGRFASGGTVRSGGGKAKTAKTAKAAGPAKPSAASRPSAPTRRKGSLPPKRRGLVPQRRAVSAAKAKLAAAEADTTASTRSKGARKGAVTKARNKLREATKTGRVKLKRLNVAFKRGKTGKPAPAPAKPAAKPTRAEKARRIKAAVQRRGTVAGKRFQDGKAVETMSMAELRSAVRKHARERGIRSKKEFELLYALGSGVTTKGKGGTESGRQPRTRSDWERIYKDTVGVPLSERNRRNGPGIFRGIDIHTNSRARYVFDLKPGASRDEINQAYRKLAKRAHPDAGGRAKDLARLTQMRDSLLAQLPKPKPAKGAKGRAKAEAPAKPRGPLLLPAAKGAAPKPRRKPRKRS